MGMCFEESMKQKGEVDPGVMDQCMPRCMDKMMGGMKDKKGGDKKGGKKKGGKRNGGKKRGGDKKGGDKKGGDKKGGMKAEIEGKCKGMCMEQSMKEKGAYDSGVMNQCMRPCMDKMM